MDSTTRPKTIKGWAYTAVKMSADLALPPVGFILECGEAISDVVFGKKVSVDEAIALTKDFSLENMQKLTAANNNVTEESAMALKQKVVPEVKIEEKLD